MSTALPGPERNKDRGQPIGLEFFATERGETPYLGDPAHVEAIVRGFAGEVHAANVAFHAGELPGPEVQKRVAEAVARHVLIFQGGDPAFRGMDGWNRPPPGGVGAGVVKRQGYEEAPEKAVETLLNVTGLAVIRAYNAILKGEMAEDDARFQVDAAVEDAVAALLGLPVTTE